jgi:hypothetical protein
VAAVVGVFAAAAAVGLGAQGVPPAA